MVIDFHTHIFPEQIAQRSVQALAERAKVFPHTDGTADGLKKAMKEQGVCLSVVLPVITAPRQFDSILRFAVKVNETEGLISFGAVFPGDPDYKERLRLIREYGLKGIKIHPDYHGTDLDDLKTLRLIEEAASLDLIISVHAGVDIGLPDPVRSTPAMAVRVLEEIGPKKLVLAHTGGWKLWDEVEELLVGRDVCFDLSFTDGYIRPGQWKRIVQNHGSGRCLFGTDSPWSTQSGTIRAVKALGLTEEEEADVFYRTAEKLGVKIPRSSSRSGNIDPGISSE